MKPSEIRSREKKELVKLLEEKRKDLFDLQLKKSVGGLADVSVLGKARKSIARLQTILREKEMPK